MANHLSRFVATATATATATAVALAGVGLCACGSGGSAHHASLTTGTRAAATSTGHAAAATTQTPTAQAAHASFARVHLAGTSHDLTLPKGWHAELWAHVNDARLEAFSPQGTLLVSSPLSGNVTELTPHGSGVPSSRIVVSGLTMPQGLAFSDLHGQEYLYVAASDALYRYRWNANGTATQRTTVIAHLPDLRPSGDDVHRYKSLTAAPDGTLYMNIGSSSNATIPGPTPSGQLPRATVIKIVPGASPAGPARVTVFATGVRNGEGLAIAPDGSVWTAVNERDTISYPFHRGYGGHADAYGQIIQGYVNNHPPDEVARLTAGRDLGWPYCDPDPDTTPGASNTSFHYANLSFTPDEQTNPGGHRFDCATLAPLQVGLPAHSAPIGMSFLTGSTLPARWRNGAVIAAHGSWDRQPPRAPAIYWLPWEARQHTLGPAITLVSGWQNANGSRWGRAADAVAGPDGSLYVADDTAGAIYRLTP